MNPACCRVHPPALFPVWLMFSARVCVWARVRVCLYVRLCVNGYRWDNTTALAAWIITHTDRERPWAEEPLTSSTFTHRRTHTHISRLFISKQSAWHFHQIQPPFINRPKLWVPLSERGSEGWFSIGPYSLCLRPSFLTCSLVISLNLSFPSLSPPHFLSFLLKLSTLPFDGFLFHRTKGRDEERRLLTRVS